MDGLFSDALMLNILYLCITISLSRIPNKVLKPGDWEQSNRGPWRPQLGFNPNRQQAHLDQSGFRKLKSVMKIPQNPSVYLVEFLPFNVFKWRCIKKIKISAIVCIKWAN